MLIAGALVMIVTAAGYLVPRLVSWRGRSHYDETLATIAERQAAFAQIVSSSGSGTVREEVERYWVETLEERILPAWYGTPWAFHGIADRPAPGFLLTPAPLREPQQSIACGHFVGVVLRDLGFHLDRLALGRLASRRIIETLVTDRRLVRRFYQAPIDQLSAAIRESGQGVYVVGLDTHTALLLSSSRGVAFVHASGLPPWCVVREPLWRSPAIRTSKVFWAGKISGDERLILRWIHRTRIPLPRS